MTDAFPWLQTGPFSSSGWVTAAGFFLATFVLEDAAAVGAGLWIARGDLSWPVAFIACFLGIWMGDASLYSLARIGGRRWFERSSLRRFAGKVRQSERWFHTQGTFILIFSRLAPGMRLPTYLAAGFLRVPLPRFLIVTGSASFLWTGIILGMTQQFGSTLLKALNDSKAAGWLLLAAGATVLAALHCMPRLVRKLRRPQWLRVRHWEFWPAWLFYSPVAAYCLWLALKYRGLALPTAANPGMFSGGVVGESKWETLQELMSSSPEFTAETCRVCVRTNPSGIRMLATLPPFTFERIPGILAEPFILKPDVGQRGAGVKLIRTRDQADGYVRSTAAPLIAQRYIPGPHEVGVFYYRFPHEPHGRIFAITEKIFPVITGDGRSTVAQLIQRDPRARHMASVYLNRFHSRRNEVLPLGVELRLVEAGNHAQGCIFRDGARLHTAELEARIDAISRKLKGFFIGRYDIRYADEDELRAGRNFWIVELNGAAAEATHIYDSRTSLISAYRTLFRQWELVFAIGSANRRRGHMPIPARFLWSEWRRYCRLSQTYPLAD